MTPHVERIGAIVLAGGRSARFGRDKLAEPIDGRPMLHHVIDIVRGIASEVVVVAAPGVTPALPMGVRLANDTRAFEGPLAGLAAGLAAMDASVERVIVVGGDMPTLVPAVLERLLSGLATHEVVLLADHDGPRPLPLAARRSRVGAAADRLTSGGERRLRALVSDLDASVIQPAVWQADDPEGATLRDVDVPADLPS
jgi:molybdopterin-guanine dinucleotide biosynthesis protein A